MSRLGLRRCSLQCAAAQRQLCESCPVAKAENITWAPPAGAMDRLRPGVLLWHSIHSHHHEHVVVS